MSDYLISNKKNLVQIKYLKGKPADLDENAIQLYGQHTDIRELTMISVVL